ncbi:ADR388Cp [Eremothecium gossypii ATCC 10895]|uniref:ADR388Cp n=2 Tax=Eremothecium gossypii TaxID=33169 RepID=E7FHG6_EREGS|nr:ADR388Cp [Eremothecium gossypii ATCC 10895]AAG41244.1 Cdc24 [Eremothecium gossypii]AAS52308.1 ADR388Cp [Eremothecium gossypii ATCC 10895]AEY96605.1 FADR388Cp [Eremothecium gossypii FDAG1]
MSNQASQSTISLRSVVSTATQQLMNKKVSEEDSLYHICVGVKRKLECLPQLKPYLALAHANAALASEQQAVLLAQKDAMEAAEVPLSPLNPAHNSMISASAGAATSPVSEIRPTSISSSTLDESEDSNAVNMEDTVLTFAMGILPSSVECDPVTELSKLFQQGSPLCIIFNAVKPHCKLPVVSSDDTKICKKSIYDFIMGLKLHFAFNDEELFTISDVFSNSTDHFTKVLDVVIALLNSVPQIFFKLPSPTMEEPQVNGYLSDHNKIVKEFVETERKYVHDLEVLSKYRQQLLENQIISSEELYMLFPNLNEIIDFQRRFLVALEINGQVPAQAQRIGALFMHSKHFFKLYEPWSIGQNAAINFISSSFDKMQSQEFVIGNKMELQSFLLKPVQRLCRYPLLLKDLLKLSVKTKSDVDTKELQTALEISKSIARSINENQRRTENHEVVKKLYGRVVNWKGYRIAKFGELLYFDKVNISTSNSNEPEKEFEVYLFEKIIILFSEVQQKKSNSRSLKIKTNSISSSSLHLSGANSPSSSAVSLTGDSKLDLRGRIMIVNLIQIIPIENHSLNITWESAKEQGNFILKFKNEETRDNWSSCLQNLLRQIRSESYKSTATGSTDRSSFSSPYGHPHYSAASINSSAVRQISEVMPKQLNHHQTFEHEYRSISENYKNSIPESMLMVRVSFNNDFYTLLVSMEAEIDDVLVMLKKKLAHAGSICKIKYQDEDGDFVMLESEDDWSVVKDMLKESKERILNVWAFV